MDVARYRRAEDALWASVGARPTERWLELEHTGAMVRILELGAGPPVVFVHGASNAGASWAPLAARLPAFRCLLVDRPGAGLSPPLDERLDDMGRFAAFAEALLVDVLDAAGIATASVVGTSFGGYFVLRGAAAHPDRFRRLVELGWTFGAPVESTPLLMRLAMQPVVGRLMAHIRPNERMVRSLLRQIGLRQALESGAFGEVELAWFLSLLRDTDTLRNEIDAAPRLTTLRGFDDATLLPSSLLRRVAMPALFVWGEDDPMGGPAIAHRFVRELPAAELELMADTGHAPWMDDPDHVAARVAAFLRSDPVPS
jgi:pimeloyl-ACP methyl ester carboxylesterase